MISKVNVSAMGQLATQIKPPDNGNTRSGTKSIASGESDVVVLSKRAKTELNDEARNVRTVKIPEPHRSILENVFRMIREGKSLPHSEFDITWENVKDAFSMDESMKSNASAKSDNEADYVASGQVSSSTSGKAYAVDDKSEKSIDITVDSEYVYYSSNPN